MAESFEHMRGRIEGGGFPHLQRALEANRAAGGSDEDLARMARRAPLRARARALMDGIEVE